MFSLKRVLCAVGRSLNARRIALAIAFMSATLSVGGLAQNICFPPHEGLPHTYLPPTIDGYTEHLPALATVDVPETGWTRGSRLTYGDDTVLPLAVLQTIKHNSQNLIYFSFDIRNDNAFDNQDVIVLVLDPAASGTSYSANARRIHIYPVRDGVGAGTGLPDETVGTVLVRKNRAPRNIEVYKWNIATSLWESTTTPSNFTAKVRSVEYSGATKHWSVEVQMPTTNSATGVGGGSDWINLGSPFAFYANLIRTCGVTTTCPTVLGDYFTTQFTWPRSDTTVSRIMVDPPTGPVPNLSQVAVPRSWLGQSILAAPGTDCRGVRFVDGSDSIGIRDPLNPTGPLRNRIDGQVTNTFVARVTNDGTAAANDVWAEFRIANWGIAADTQNWFHVPHTSGTNPTAKQNIASGGSTEFSFDWLLNSTERAQYTPPRHHQCVWVKLNSTSGVDFVESSVRRNMDFVNLSKKVLSAEISGKGFPSPKNGNTHDIILETALVTLPNYSEKYPQVAVGTVLREQGATRGEKRDGQQELIQSLTQLDKLAWLRQLESKETLSQWVWVVYGHRDTGQALTLGGKRFRVLDHVGSFGYFAEHVGPASGGFSASIGSSSVGSGLTTGPGGTYALKVPHAGAVSINTTLEAKEECKCSCADMKCKMECDKQANSGSTMLAGSLMLFGTVGVGGLAYIRRRKLLKRNNS